MKLKDSGNETEALTRKLNNDMISEIRDRGRTFYQYFAGCGRHMRKQKKGKSAESAGLLRLWAWAWQLRAA